MELTKVKHKQTEVGLIPEDWDVVPMSEITTLMTNGFVGTAKTHYTEDRNGITYIQGYNVKANSFNFTGIKKVTPEFHKRNKKSKLKEGDILTVQTGDVGLTTIVPKELEGSNCHALIISRFNYNKAYPWFYAQYFNSTNGRARLVELETGTTMKHINVGELIHWLVPLPPTLTEQKAIATSLNDLDDLISNLDKLITKKKAIKQGAMQQLLTPPSKGGKHLAGYTGDWVETPLDNVAWYQEGPGVRKHQFTSRGVKLLNGTNIQYGVLDLEKTDRYISEKEAFGWYSHFLVDEADILIACSGITVARFDEKVTVAEKYHLPLCMNTSTMRFKMKSELIDKSYFMHYLKSSDFKNQIGGQATGSAQLNFGPSHVGKVIMEIPNLNEQKAIAQILTDMDHEIQKLARKLGKYQDIKQGMMQELLTGKTRLV